MPSFFSRLLGRRGTLRSADATTPSQPVIPFDTSPGSPKPPQKTREVVRKILPNINELFESYSEGKAETPEGLRPNIRKGSVVKPLSADQNTSQDGGEIVFGGWDSPKHDANLDERRNRRSSHNASRPPVKREWSTFGRRSDTKLTQTDDLEQTNSLNPSFRYLQTGNISQPGSLRRSRSIKGKGTSYNYAASDRPTTDTSHVSTSTTPGSSDPASIPSGASSNAYDSKHSSPANTMRVNQGRSLRRKLPSIPNGLRPDSSATFGQLTPAGTRSRLNFGMSSTLTPMPPLIHPDLTRCSLLIPSNIEISQVRRMPREHTFPRRNARRLSTIDGNYSFPFRLGRTSHFHSTPFATLESIFPPLQQNEDLARPGSSSLKKPKHTRRFSADWNSRQAAISDTSWPAQVSREILRLSLSEAISSPEIAGVSGILQTRGHDISCFSAPGTSYPLPSFLRDPRPPTSQGLSSTEERLTSASFSPSVEVDAGENYLSQAVKDTHNHTRFTSTSTSREIRGGMDGSPVSKGAAQYSVKRLPVTVHDSPRVVVSRASTSKDAQAKSIPVSFPPPFPTPHAASDTPSASLAVPGTPVRARSESSTSKGKRKADEVEGTPPDQKKETQRATFAIPPDSRALRPSSSSHAPSSYQRKRARLTAPQPSPSHSRPGSAQPGPGGSLSRTNSRPQHLSRTPSRAASAHSNNNNNSTHTDRQPRRSMSQISIPISALVSPHAPSISRSTTYHMQDPRKPPRKQATPWSLRFATEDDLGSPVQAWCFFIGFVLFPIWWIASFWRIRETRHVGGTDTEKAVPLDDPQIEHDTRSWRIRCRIMSVVSLFTYLPFIILIATFAPR